MLNLYFINLVAQKKKIEMAVELVQKSLEKENPPVSLICCFEDSESTCLHDQRDSGHCIHLKTLKKFLELRLLDVNALYQFGNTMLHLAAKDANSKAIKLLLDNGADANVRNDSNETPIFLIFSSRASNERKRECVEMFMLHEADYDLVNSEGDTLIKVALKNGSFFSLQPIVAHLAWLQELGLPIDEKVFEQINFVRILNQYHRACVQHLDEMKYKRIHENILEYDILTQNEETIAASYMRNPSVARKLEQHEVNSDLYYNSLFKLQLVKAMEIKRLRLDGSNLFRKSIKLFQHSSHIIVDKIIGYLNHNDLHALKQIVEEGEKEEECLNGSAYNNFL